MKAGARVAIGVAASLMAVGPQVLAGADGSNTAKSAASVFQENPRQSDPTQEVQRLRNEGVAKYESGLALDDAQRAFEEAAELSGQAADSFNVALVYFKKNDVAGSRKWLEQALQRDPDFPNAYYLRGLLARSEGDLAGAKKDWERARGLAPDDPYVHYQLALIAQSERNEPAFLQSLVNALGLEPDNTAALYQMYRYYQTSGNRELADQTLAKFNALKKQEKFSRREKQKDPGKLAQPIVAPTAAAKGFEVIAVAPSFEVTQTDPGCKAVAADAYVTLVGGAVDEAVAIACADGRLVRAQPLKTPGFTDAGKIPSDTRDIRLEWFDEKGPRVLALTDAGLSLASQPIGTGEEYSSIETAAKAPVVLADLDTDGDIDIVAGAGQVPLTNAGKLKFIHEDALYQTGPLPGQVAGARAVVVADVQRHGLSDLLILRDDALVVAAGSPAGFREALRLPAAAGASAMVVGDFSNDGRLDVALLMPDALRIAWNLDLQSKAAPATQDIPLGVKGPRQLLAMDYNNDGLLDLLVVGDDGQAAVLRNQGNRGFAEQALGKWPTPAAGTRLIAGDFDQDGRVDLAYVTAAGGFAAARNTTDGVGNAIALFLNGVRANPSGLLTQFEVRRGTQYAYAQSPGGVARIGIGKSGYAEVLRLEWTTGFVESKLKVDAATKPYVFKESERISGSCPSLFVWNGERFDYLTDTFISGPMGVPLDRGRYFHVRDHGEMLVIPGDRVKLRDGRLDIRFTEELHESVFVDRLRMLVVDHPVGTQVYPHSRLAPAPAPAEPFYTAGDLIAPARATGSDGTDLTATLATVDKVNAGFFRRSQHAGFAEPHWIDLDLPQTVDPADVDAVLATGWFFYFESTSMIAEAQYSGAKLPWPWLEQFVDGAWQEVGPVGIPTGKGKTAVVPVKGLLRSRQLRIRSGIAIYWDRIAFALTSGVTSAQTSEAPLIESTLRLHGFSALTSRNPELFDYHAISYAALWSPMRGHFTAYGPIESLVDTTDGKYAVFGSGDEIAMSFAVDQPAPPPGQTRSYLLQIIGYVKDGDRYTAHAGQVEPVPYLGLVDYPAPADERLREAQTRSPYRTRDPLDYTLTTLSGSEEVQQ